MTASRTALPPARPELLAPGTPGHQVMGDVVLLLYPLPTFVVPLLHPATSEGTAAHDPTFASAGMTIPVVVRRLRDTVELIAGVAHAGAEADDCAYAIRELHRHISGTLPSGEDYHAWSQDIWTWNWAAIVAGVMAVYEQYRGWPDDDFRDHAYAGLVEAGRRFGVRGMPLEYPTFAAEWPPFFRAQAQSQTRGLSRVMATVHGPELLPPSWLEWLPQPVWMLATAPVRATFRRSLQATLPDDILAELDCTPSTLDRWVGAGEQAVWRLVPRSASYRAGRVYFDARLRFGTPVWRRHHSREALAQRKSPVQR